MKASTNFAGRLAALRRATGLSAGQLGVARVYESPRRLDRGSSFSDATVSRQHLLGEEVLIKDLQQLAGEYVTFGNEGQGFVADFTDSAATRLLDAGAVLVGASTSAEFGTVAYTEPVGQDEPVNPVRSDMMVGGSSGGAAVAVARGLVRFAHATDGGGSIRIPAAACGLVGLKPAHDASRGGFTPVAHGFVAGSFADTRRAYQLDDVRLVGLDEPSRLTVGFTSRPFHHAPLASCSGVDPQIAAATAAATALLATSSAVEQVTSVPVPYPVAEFSLFTDVFQARCADLPEPLSPMTSWLKQQGQQIPEWRVDTMVDRLAQLRRDVRRRWEGAGLDVVATPMLACAPPPPGTFSSLSPRLNFWAQTAWTPWATLWNICGWASVTVPLVAPEHVPGRWPIALQLGAVGDRVSEAELLSLAEQVQQVVRQSGAFSPEQLSIDVPGDVHA